MTLIASLKKLFTAAILVAAVALAALMLLPQAAGYQRYVILTGSMAGTYDPGSIVYAKSVPVAQLQVGDVITYSPPRGKVSQELVTHRIASIRRGPDGRRVFRTKGDANRSADPWRFTLDQPTQARVSFGVPFAGRLVMALTSRSTRMVVIGGPAMLIALLALAGLVRDLRRGPAPDPHPSESAA